MPFMRYKGEIIAAVIGLAAAGAIAFLVWGHSPSSISIVPGSGPVPLTLSPGQSASLQPAANSSAVIQFDPTLSTPQSQQAGPPQGAPTDNSQLQQSPSQVLQNPSTSGR